VDDLFNFGGSITTPPVTNQEKAQSTNSSKMCFDVVIKQKVEGCWDENDSELQKMILKEKKLPKIPQELGGVSDPALNSIWMTILVLIWLEIACANERKIWLLIHQKGSEWLKRKGIDYEKLKEVGKDFIQL